MKQRIKKEIAFELKKDKTDKNYIKILKSLLEKEEPITFKMFTNTGRIIRREEFEYYYPDIKLRDDCRGIVKYAGEFYIQILHSGAFFVSCSYGDTISPILDSIELSYWLSDIKNICQ